MYTARLYSGSDFNNYVAAIYKVLGTFLFGAAVSQSLTDLGKYMIGRLRPNFLAVCDPDWSRVNCSVYVQEEVCRGSPANVTESRWVLDSSPHSGLCWGPIHRHSHFQGTVQAGEGPSAARCCRITCQMEPGSRHLPGLRTVQGQTSRCPWA